jgi:hypothetical protein
MHRLNFCGSLCLPKVIEGYESRGMRVPHYFRGGAILPMASPMALKHIIYCSSPVSGSGEILMPEDLDTREKVDRELRDGALAPDYAVDPDERCRPVFEQRNANLAWIAERLFSAGHERVVIFTHSGLGNAIRESDPSDGLIRDGTGVAYAMRLDGKLEPIYGKGLPARCQNTGHEHIHVIPVGYKVEGKDYDSQIDLKIPFKLEKTLRVHEEDKSGQMRRVEGSLEEFAEVIRIAGENPILPVISWCTLDHNSDLGKQMKHRFYLGRGTQLLDSDRMAGFIRKNVLGQTNAELGLDLEDKDTQIRVADETFEFYQGLLGN